MQFTNRKLVQFITGYLVCKTCGSDSSVLNLIDNTRISSFNSALTNVTIAEKDILVQDLINPRGITFKVIISKKANCAESSGWFTDNSWFEGFAWKVCLCPTCKQHLGWIFDTIDSAKNNPINPSDKGFYAIILDHVILESCKF